MSRIGSGVTPSEYIWANAQAPHKRCVNPVDIIQPLNRVLTAGEAHRFFIGSQFINVKNGSKMKDEKWKTIEGYESYMVSNKGRVYTKRFKKIMSPGDNGRGYLFVYLWGGKKRKSKRFYVHRLVGNAFIPNPQTKPQINHKDCNKANNHVDNLEWVTLSENMKHASQNNRIIVSEYHKKQITKYNSGTGSHLSKLDNNSVKEIRRLHKIGLTQKAISQRFGVHRATIGYIVTGKSWKHILT